MSRTLPYNHSHFGYNLKLGWRRLASPGVGTPPMTKKIWRRLASPGVAWRRLASPGVAIGAC